MVDRHDLPLEFGRRLVGLKSTGRGLELRFANGPELLARTVLLAIGRRGTPRKLGVPGEELPKVHYRLLDARDYQNLNILVVGGGDNAVEAAIGLARDGMNRVWLSYRREKIVRARERNLERLREWIRRGWVIPVMPSRVVRIEPDRVVLETSGGTESLPNDYVFCMIGWEPPFDLLRTIGIRFWSEVGSVQGG